MSRSAFRPGSSCSHRRWWGAFAAMMLAVGIGHAQEPEDIAQRVLDGGWFETPIWRRGADGQLNNHYIADAGGAVAFGPDDLRLQPLLGEGLQFAFVRTGAAGMATLFLHGRHDLLAMADAEFHLAVVGLPTTDVEMRLSLLEPLQQSDPALRRAELFDRLLTIDLLERHGHAQAAPELRVLAAKAEEPALRRRAARAVVALTGKGDVPPRQRLDPEQLLLPAVIDGWIVVEHARLPDLGFVAGLLRRLSAVGIADRVASAGRGASMPPAMTNGCQTTCDSVAELPFAAALQWGNARHDQSVVVLTGSDRGGGVGLTWQAAGEYEHERWQQALLPIRAAELDLFAHGELQVAAEHVEARYAVRSAGRPRPELAREMLADTGAAIRCVVPAASRLWPQVFVERMPSARGAELRVTFGDVLQLDLRIDVPDERAAAAWREHLGELLQAARKELAERLPDATLERADVAAALEAAFAPTFGGGDEQLTVTVKVPGVTPALVRVLAEALR
ncbi:MAG: hypothetical protein R3F29_15255 [Planctomycetota bacterium]